MVSKAVASTAKIQNQVFELDYIPREQFVPFHQRKERWACMVCHRRAGKTVACIFDLVLRALYTTKKNARYAYIAPTYSQAKDVAWQYLKDAVAPIAVEIRVSELRVVLPNGAFITLYGSENQDRLRGLFFDGLICDEYGDCRPSLWGEVLLPALLDRNGWAVFIGTPKLKNHFYKTFTHAEKSPEWFSFMLRADESGILNEKQLAAVRAESTEEEYQQEMLCNFTASVRGTYYADLIQKLEGKKQIKPQRLYDPMQPVNVACDLGFTDSTAFWFWQTRPDGIAIIDYYENHGKSLVHYFELLASKNYVYETIFLPHDAKAKTLQTGRSTIEQFLEEGFPCAIAPTLALQHGIDAVRKVLPRCWFDEEKCTKGIEALRAYKRKWDDLNQCFSNAPLHDFASNGSDAFRYLSLVAQDRLPAAQKEKPEDLPAIQPPTEYRLDQMFEAHEHSGKLQIHRMRI